MINENRKLQLTFAMSLNGNKTVNLTGVKTNPTLAEIRSAVKPLIDTNGFLISSTANTNQYATSLYAAKVIETTITDIVE